MGLCVAAANSVLVTHSKSSKKRTTDPKGNPLPLRDSTPFINKSDIFPTCIVTQCLHHTPSDCTIMENFNSVLMGKIIYISLSRQQTILHTHTHTHFLANGFKGLHCNPIAKTLMHVIMLYRLC